MAKLYTVGHSNRSLEEFVAVLKAHDISCLVDIRSIPKSRKLPWFNKEELKAALEKERISYIHMQGLGGLRHARKDSSNHGWHNLSFRGYADYMQTADFFLALKRLNHLLEQNENKTAIMCAEALPWRCHRSLVADAEMIRGINVFHIMNQKSLHQHELTPFAVIDRSKRPLQIHYPSEESVSV